MHGRFEQAARGVVRAVEQLPVKRMIFQKVLMRLIVDFDQVDAAVGDRRVVRLDGSRDVVRKVPRAVAVLFVDLRAKRFRRD